MSLARLWASFAVVLPVVAALAATLSAVDLAYHLRAGDQIVAGGGIPRVDTFTFTAAGREWIDQQWGAQVILATTYRLGGWVGLVVLRAALVGVLFGLIFLACRLRGADIRLAAGLSLAAFIVAAPALALRPQLLGMVLLAVTLVLVAVRRQHPRLFYLVLAVVVIWANVHGSFFLGPLVIGLAWLEDVHERAPAASRTLVIAVVAALATVVNPFGLAVWAYAVGLSINPEVTARISEWQPTTLRTIPGILFFASTLGVVVILARRGRPSGWPTLAWLGVFFVVGAYAIRGVAWWPIGAAFALAGVFGRGAESPEMPTPPMGRRINVGIVAALVVAGIVLLPIWRATDPATGAPTGGLTDAPSGVTATLRTEQRPGDRVFNPQPWGSWFEFATPELPVAIDSRIELFPVETWEQYETVASGGGGWQAVLDHWGVTIVVAGPRDAALIARLHGNGWRDIYVGPDGTILRRTAPASSRSTWIAMTYRNRAELPKGNRS
jgi:hypothetical protein